MTVRLTSTELQAWVHFIYTISGIHLDQSKAYLLENRLGALLVELKLASFGELHARAKADPTRALQRRIIDLITTGETSFFRDNSPFELLRHKVLPDLIDRRNRAARSPGSIPIRVWSAACSTGQEVYTIAIVLRELLGADGNYNIRLVGTDLSDKAIATASRGEYNKLEMARGLSPERVNRYFTQTATGWKIRDEIRALASFRTLNLMDDFSSIGRFDIVFCRNVAIYFSEPDRTALFHRLGRTLERDGYLIIGSTESLVGLCPEYQSQMHLRSVFYQLKAA